jgi:dynein heavy chain
MLGRDHVEGIDVIKSTDANFMKLVELGLQLGKWILIENVPTELDPALDPILL